jgi:hypothetical protein
MHLAPLSGRFVPPVASLRRNPGIAAACGLA